MPTINPQETALLRELQAGGEINRFAVFSELADEYHRRNPGTYNKDLAALLGERPQTVSQWKSGSDPRRRPTWKAIVLLLHLCKRKLEVTPAGVVLKRHRRRAS